MAVIVNIERLLDADCGEDLCVAVKRINDWIERIQNRIEPIHDRTQHLGDVGAEVELDVVEVKCCCAPGFVGFFRIRVVEQRQQA